MDSAIRPAEVPDAELIGRLLHEFNHRVRRAHAGGTSEQDVAARALYESVGFSNREGRPDGLLNPFYEREL